MKKTTYLLILLILFNLPLVASSQEPIGQEIPKEVIFVDDSDIINIYDLETNEFITGIKLNERKVDSFLESEKKSQVNIISTYSTLNKIIYSNDPVESALKEYNEGNIKLEFDSLSKKVKFKLFLTGLTIANLF